jgi:hypothetical protein
MSDDTSTEGEYRDDPYERLRWFYSTRPGGLYPPAVRAKRRDQNARALTADPVVSGQPYWTPLGPSVNAHGQTIGSQPVSGRVTAIAVAPDGGRAYVGSANGGVWLTENRGATWRPIDDDHTTPPALRVGHEQDSLAVGGLAVAFGPTRDADVIYVGTGEGNSFVEPQYGDDQFDTDTEYFGIGVLRYTWSGGVAVATAEAAGPFGTPGSLAGRYFSRLVVDPDDSGVVWAATKIGFFVRDGSGAWQHRQLAPAPQFDIVCDVAIAGTGADRRVYVAYGGSGVVGIYDPNLDQFVGQFTAIPRGGALDSVYRLGIAAAARAPGDHVVYALAESGSVYRAEPAVSTTFTELANPPALQGFGQLGYCMDIQIEPGSNDVLWLAGAWTGNYSTLALWRCTVQSGAGQPSLTGSTMLGSGIHPDGHAIAFGGDGTAWIGCDGGVWTGAPPYAPGTFVARNTGLAITQLTYFGQDVNTDAVIFCGCQDNGLVRWHGSASWDHVGDGDGGGAALHPFFPYRVFWEVSAGAGFNSSDDGSNFGYISVPFGAGSWAYAAPVATTVSPPTASDPQDHALLAFAADKLWVSDDWATNWEAVTGVITATGSGEMKHPTAVDVAVRTVGGPGVVKVIGASPLDIRAAERLTGSDQWNEIPGISSAGLPADRHISAVAFADASTNAFYVTLAGTASQRVWYFDGSTWHDAGLSAGGSPLNVPVHDVVCDGPFQVFVGTDVGVFIGARSGTTWQWSPLSAGLPECAVTDLAIHEKTRLLRAATHGRGLWEIPLDVETTGPQPDHEVYFRANAADTGRVPNGARFPWTEGVPDPTRPNAPLLFHWDTPDIKVVAAPDLPSPPAAPTYLDYHLLVDKVDSDDFESVGDTNHFFVQVHNRGWKPAGSLHVALLVAPCGAGLPWLGNPNYSSGVAAGNLNWAGGSWFPVGPVRTPAVPVDARNPLVVSWQDVTFGSLGLPNTDTHICAAAFVTSPDDLRQVASNSVDQLAMTDPHVAQRNMHVIHPHFGMPRAFVVDVWNQTPNDTTVDVELVAHDYTGEVSLVTSTINRGEGPAGLTVLRPAHLDEFDDPSVKEHWREWKARATDLADSDSPPSDPFLLAQIEQLRRLDFNFAWAALCEPDRPAAFRGVGLRARDRMVAAIVLHPGAEAGPEAALSVLQRDEAGNASGSTFRVRPEPREASRATRG